MMAYTKHLWGRDRRIRSLRLAQATRNPASKKQKQIVGIIKLEYQHLIYLILEGF